MMIGMAYVLMVFYPHVYGHRVSYGSDFEDNRMFLDALRAVLKPDLRPADIGPSKSEKSSAASKYAECAL